MENISDKNDIEQNEYLDINEIPSDTDYKPNNLNQKENQYQIVKESIVYQMNTPSEENLIYNKVSKENNSNLNSNNYNMNEREISYQYMNNYKTNISDLNKSNTLNKYDTQIKKICYYSNKRESGPRDSVPKKNNKPSGIRNHKNFYFSSNKNYSNLDFYREKQDIPRIMFFQKNDNYSKEKENLNFDKNYNFNESLKIKKGNSSQLMEIPRSEYGKYQANDTIVIGRGMDTGKYKFNGLKMVINEKDVPKNNLFVDEIEIYKQINKRKNKFIKGKRESKKKLEVVDKFYASTEYNKRPFIIQSIKGNFNKKQNLTKNDDNEKYFNVIKERNNSNLNSYEFDYNSEKSHIKNISENLNFSKNQNFNVISYNYNNNYNNTLKYTNQIVSPKDNYSKYLLEQINKIREDPQSFIGIIEDAKDNITINRYGRIIYNGKIKISLSRGESAFDEAIYFLKNKKPMRKLEFSELITVQSPRNENDINDKDYMRLKVKSIIEKGINIRSYWRDVIKDPEISFLLMIVDDNGHKSGKKRKDILNPNMKYIGISSVEINNNFACYITLSTGF